MIRKITLFMTLAILSTPLYAADECAFAYQNATYGLQHAQTAMEANNKDHLLQYAKRSKEALQKVLAATDECGCTDANYASYDALENLDKAFTKVEFDKIRYYVDKARVDVKATIVALDLCDSADPSLALELEESSLEAQEEELRQQQKRLLAQQKRLEERPKEQKRLQDEIRQQKAAMLVTQKEVRIQAEASLVQLEELINSFTDMMGCNRDMPLTESPYTKSITDLETETLTATKIFYAEKAREMANNLLNRLGGCEWKED